jgi:hypothetical protein
MLEYILFLLENLVSYFVRSASVESLIPYYLSANKKGLCHFVLTFPRRLLYTVAIWSSKDKNVNAELDELPLLRFVTR